MHEFSTHVCTMVRRETIDHCSDTRGLLCR